MAVKIVRQPKKITLVGASTSAAGLRGGQERGPAALRTAGLADRLKTAGFTVADLGDTSVQLKQPDDEHPRARNVQPILKSLNDLRPMVEVAVKSGALPLILSGDSISVLATIAGIRRYFRDVTLVYMDRDAALNFPATSASGFIDGMVLSHVIGRGAPELVRFWGEPPLVRESDIVLFGFERVDPPEQQYLSTSLFRSYPAQTIVSQGSAASARKVLDRIEGSKHQFILHVDLDVIDSEVFQSVNLPGRGGLNLGQVREALKVFAGHPNLLAIDVAGYNPELDPNGEGARLIVDLLADVLGARLEPAPETSSTPGSTGATEATGGAAEPENLAGPAVGEAAHEASSPASIEPDSPGPSGSDSIPI